jgi:small subunit ribosomal protein S6
LAATVYEGMLILDSTRYARDPDGIANQIHSMIQEAGGEILVSRLWEERRLAYPIKGQRKGAYWLTYFRLDGPKLDELTRKCQINENILRVLFLKVDPRIVDALVEHARSGQILGSRPEPVAVHEGAAAAVDEDGDIEDGEE